MKEFIRNGVPSVSISTVNFTTTGVVIQPPSVGRIYITDVIATNSAITLTNASSVTSGNVLAYVAQGNCNFSVPVRVPDLSGVAISTASAIGSINYFLE
jgi:hypothetical protein